MKRISTMLWVLCISLSAMFAQVQVPLEQGVDGTLTNITPIGVAVTTAEEQRGLRGKNIAVTSQFVFFLANDSVNSGEELWVTDGTFANTRMVRDINPGTDGSDPKHLCAVGDTVYFSADNGTDGAELWMSDGTEAGTKMVEDIFIGPGNSSAPDMMIPFKGGVLFRAKDNISAADNDKSYLWWSADGTEANTSLLHPIQPVIVPDGQEITQIQVTGNGEKAFFVGLDDTTGQELWVTWGDSTKLVLDIGFQADTASQVPGKTVDTDIRWLYAVNDDQIWFRPFTPSFWTGDSMIIDQFDFLDNELWVSNGQPWGTYPLGDLNDNPSQNDPRISGNTGSAFPRNFNGRTYFRANDGVTGTEMHSTDLTPGDFPLVQNINGTNNNGVDQNNFLEQFEIFDGFMYFKGIVSVDDSANTGFARVGQELFRVALDPEPRIEFVFDIFTGPTNNSFPREMKTVNNRMYFRANDAPNQSNYELWCLKPLSEDSTSTPFKVAEMPENTFPGNLVNFNEKLVYVGRNVDQIFVYEDGRPIAPYVPTDGLLDGPPVTDFENPQIPKPIVNSTDKPLYLKEVVKVYPNPVNQVLHIELVDRPSSVTGLYNAEGKLVWRGNINGGHNYIEVSHLPNGVYALFTNIDGYFFPQKILIRNE